MHTGRYSRNNGIGFYIFWFIMLIFASLIVTFVYNKWYKENSFENIFTSINSKDTTADNTIVKTQSQIFEKSSLSTPLTITEQEPLATITEKNKDIPANQQAQEPAQTIEDTSEIISLKTIPLKTVLPKDTIFKDAILNNAAAYMNNSGTLYNAGYIHVTGEYPKDFIPYSNNAHPSTQVSIKIYVGWKNLEPLSIIENINKQKATITLPLLQALKTEITMSTNAFLKLKLRQEQQKTIQQEISTAINKYIQAVFNEYQINKNTMLQAYKNLAKEYIARNYKNITVLPFKTQR